MKYVVLLTIFAVATAVDYYKPKDDIDMDAIIADHEDFMSYIDCYLDKGPCTDIATSFKVNIRESIEQTCARCSDKLKYLYNRFFKAMIEIFPESYVEYKQHFDPENKHLDDLIKEVSTYTNPPVKK